MHGVFDVKSNAQRTTVTLLMLCISSEESIKSLFYETFHCDGMNLDAYIPTSRVSSHLSP